MKKKPIRGRRLLPTTTTPTISIVIILIETLSVTVESEIFQKTIKTVLLFPLLVGLALVPSTVLGNSSTISARRTLYFHAYLNTPIAICILLGFPLASVLNGLIAQILFITPLTLLTFIYGLIWITVFGVRLSFTIILSALFEVVYLVTTPLRIAFTNEALVILLPMVILLISFEILLKIRAGAVTGMDLIKAFAGSWMDRNSDLFDSVCQKIGKPCSVGVSLHSFIRKDDGRVAIIIPYIHPGPAKSIGSAELPSLLYEQSNAYNIMVFHGASNHSLNLATRRETERITHLIYETLDKQNDFIDIKRIGICNVNGADVSINKYTFLENTVYFVSKKNNTEDLPAEIVKLVDGRKDIVDRHNGLCDEKTAMYNDSNVNETLRLIEKIGSLPNQEFEIEGLGYCRKKMTRDDIGPGGISALVFKGDKKIGFVSIDANNLACGLESIIQQTIKKLGFDQVEIATTDNHWNSGIRNAQLGYKPAGTADAGSLVKEIVATVLEAERRISPARYHRDYLAFTTTILGEDGLLQLVNALDKGAKMMYLLMSITVVLSIIAIIF
jgi:predicted neutral ceramidase superfamily lipid hydrolase